MITNNALRNIARKDSRGFGVVGAGSAGVPRYQDYDTRTITDEGYRKNIIVSACIQMIATSAPEAPLRIYRETNKGLVLDENHWFNRLLKKPNDAHSPFELWEYVHTYMNTGGAAYLELVRTSPNGEILEMYPLRPDRIRVVPGVDTYISHYEYWIDGKKIIYEPWEILCIKFPDPLDEFNGLSPIKRVMRELGIDNEATDFTKTFFDNAAVPYGLLTTDQNISEPEADRVRWRWQKWFMGAKRFMVAVLGKGMNYQQMGLSFQEMEFESLRSMTETRLCAAFGVDPVLLPSWVGIKHGGKYSNYSEARRHLWEETIVPILRRIESKITSELLEEGVIARFDLSEVQALQENENEKATRIALLFEKGLINLNEGREELGFDPVPEGDVYANEGTNSGNTNNNGNDRINNSDNTNNNNKSINNNIKKKNLITHKALDDFGKQMMELYKKGEEVLKAKLRNLFKKLKAEFIREVEARTKTETDKADLVQIQELIDQRLTAWQEAGQEFATSELVDILESGGSLAAALMGREFDGTSPQVLLFIERYAPRFAQSFAETTRKELKAKVLQAQLEGWGIPKLKDELKATFNQFSNKRVEMIARSEVIRSSNAGAKIAFEQSNIKQLEWLYTNDERTCPFCRAMHGKVVSIHAAFLKEGETMEIIDNEGKKQTYTNRYETVEFPPLHPNCRCTILPVLD